MSRGKLNIVVAALLLSFTYIVAIQADGGAINATSPVKARLKQLADGYYGPGDDGPPQGAYEESDPYKPDDKDPECPAEQPADTVKEVYIAHGSFLWREVAAKAEQLQRKTGKLVTSAPLLEKGAHTAAYIVRNKPASAKPSAAVSTAAVSTSPTAPAPAAAVSNKATAPAPAAAAASPAAQATPTSTTAQPSNKPAASTNAQPSNKPAASTNAQPSNQAANSSAPVQQSTTGAGQPGSPASSNTTQEGQQAATNKAPGTSPSAEKLQATTQYIADKAFLLPTSVDQQGKGYPGTYDPSHFPSSEALAVGPHPTEEDLIFVLHAINAQAEVLPAEKDGTPVENVTPTKVPLYDLSAKTGIDMTNLEVSRVVAFYDADKKRYVLMWSTYAVGPVTGTPPLFVASSLTDNPLAAWVVWALDMRPEVAAGVGFCADEDPSAFYLSDLQASYSKDGIFIGATPTCKVTAHNTTTTQRMSSLYVMSKEALCEPTPASDPDRDEPGYRLYAAIYFASVSWYRSVSESERGMVPDAYKPFNSHIMPARPQHPSDLEDEPLFVMKVSAGQMSIATLSEAPLKLMCSGSTAPLLRAVVVGKGGDFANVPGTADGNPYMPQPRTNIKLSVTGVGMPAPYGGMTSWATMHKGLLYVTAGEYWGVDNVRIPSIYWAIFKPTEDICHLSREAQGFVASRDGLSLAYPVIAGKGDRAVLAFSYSGPSTLPGGQLDAFPGVAMAAVGHDTDAEEGIDVVKRGPGSLIITDPAVNKDNLLPWGHNSAAHVCGDQMWFAVPIPARVGNDYNASLWYGSWISYAHV